MKKAMMVSAEEHSKAFHRLFSDIQVEELRKADPTKPDHRKRIASIHSKPGGGMERTYVLFGPHGSGSWDQILSRDAYFAKQRAA